MSMISLFLYSNQLNKFVFAILMVSIEAFPGSKRCSPSWTISCENSHNDTRRCKLIKCSPDCRNVTSNSSVSTMKDCSSGCGQNKVFSSSIIKCETTLNGSVSQQEFNLSVCVELNSTVEIQAHSNKTNLTVVNVSSPKDNKSSCQCLLTSTCQVMNKAASARVRPTVNEPEKSLDPGDRTMTVICVSFAVIASVVAVVLLCVRFRSRKSVQIDGDHEDEAPPLDPADSNSATVWYIELDDDDLIDDVYEYPQFGNNAYPEEELYSYAYSHVFDRGNNETEHHYMNVANHPVYENTDSLDEGFDDMPSGSPPCLVQQHSLVDEDGYSIPPLDRLNSELEVNPEITEREMNSETTDHEDDPVSVKYVDVL